MSYNHPDVIHTLWDELADFDASRSDEALTHLMNGLCALAEVRNIVWLGAGRGQLSAHRAAFECRGTGTDGKAGTG